MCLQCVSKLLFNKELEKDELPSSTIVQSIVDKEHFLVKKVHISDEVAVTEQWVLNRDSTTKRNQKIPDTSITLLSRSIISLGLNRVSKETTNPQY